MLDPLPAKLIASAELCSRWCSLAATVKVAGPLPVSFIFEHNAYGVWCRATMHTINRDTGEPLPVSIDRCIGTREPAVLFFIRLASVLYLHELREFFLVSDERIFDPHDEVGQYADPFSVDSVERAIP